jgi:CheY-like chemotaxis protein
LGLSVSHGIVTSLGGSIHLDSTPGEGTVVEIVLPPAGGVDLATRDVAPVVGGAGRRGRILVVDDEPHVRASLYRLLGGEHEVLTMGSGAEALAYLDVDARVDVILCDLMMPDVTGMALHAELSARVPEHAARMVFLTGGAFTAQALAFLEAVPNPRVDKPFDGPELRRIVAALVDGA